MAGVGVFESYARAKTGPRVDENEWDSRIIPQTARRLKEKYGLKIDKKQIIPTDGQLINNIFRAGMEMLVECGIYCMDTKRVIKFTEEEVWRTIKTAPRRVILGEGRDAVTLKARRFDEKTPPIIQGGPTGAPVAEQDFIAMHEAYAREPIVDTIVDGVLQTINGYDPSPNTPFEIAAVKSEAMMVRLAQARAGRPGMAL
ncbi:MAG: monomethylamine:corrinoid methyltransferase [Peptococcaceae bacterium]|nr:monomethylamine:corrinoid methyltransferase [Peptococcaceae bacterium]